MSAQAAAKWVSGGGKAGAGARGTGLPAGAVRTPRLAATSGEGVQGTAAPPPQRGWAPSDSEPPPGPALGVQPQRPDSGTLSC